MPIGDVLEWLGVACLVAAAFIWSGTVLAVAVAGVALLYFAQCYSGHQLVTRKSRRES